MIYGIIDLGSNTIRLSLYKFENEEIELLLNKKTMAGLAGYVKDGNLSGKGIEIACKVLKEYKDILENFNVENYSVFSTASLRNINNTKDVVEVIKSETSFDVDVISGEDEARLDFIGATQIMDVTDGLLVDIGGGSTELVLYKNKTIIDAVSIPIGSLNLFCKCVSNILPTKDEKKEIKKLVIKELDEIFKTPEVSSKLKNCELICGVGGTVRATKHLINDRYSLPEFNKEIKTKSLKKLLKSLSKPNKDTLKNILQVVPERVHTVVPGIIILDTIAKYFESETIIVSRYGVREGYLYNKVLKKGV